MSVWSRPYLHSDEFHLDYVYVNKYEKFDLFAIYMRQSEENKKGKKCPVFISFVAVFSVFCK